MSRSSGEAETGKVTEACSEALSMRFVATDMGFELHAQPSLEVGTDSSAAHRRRSGKVQDLEAAWCLWILQAIACGKIAVLVKAPGKLNE